MSNSQQDRPQRGTGRVALLRRLCGWIPVRLVVKGFRLLFTRGPGYTFYKLRRKLALRRRRRQEAEALATLSVISERQRREEQAACADIPATVTFSIVVPLYNTPERFLREMIESVLSQTYDRLELCLADGSDAEHADVERTVGEYTARDARVRYLHLEENRGISENTNAAVRMARGQYLALLDHDDLLHPSALYRVACAIRDQGADFVYTDEAVFTSPDITRITTVHYKPDYARDTLRANNYICHFSVFARALTDRVGLFRSDYDGSQDHDLILRLTGAAERVVHIPRVLYFWRSHPASVAMDLSSKSYAADAGRRAVADELKRMGMAGTVESSEFFAAIYRVRYAVEDRARVALIVCDEAKTISAESEQRFLHTLDALMQVNDWPQSQYYAVTAHRQLCERLPEGVHGILTVGNAAERAKYGAEAALEGGAEYLLFVSPQLTLTDGAFVRELLMLAQRPDVGVVGGKLYLPDGRVAEAGEVLLSSEKTVAPYHYGASGYDNGYMGRLSYVQNVSAVSGRLMMIAADSYRRLGGLDGDYPTLYSEELCLRAREAGLLNVFTPYAAGRLQTAETALPDGQECERLRQRYGIGEGYADPYYNPAFSQQSGGFESSFYAV